MKINYIKEWQTALQIEIQYLKKFGSTKFLLTEGQFISKESNHTYYFHTVNPIRIPTGAIIKLQCGSMNQEGRIQLCDGNNIIINLDKFIGNFISEAFLFHDPWELLDQLIERLEEIKKSKKKIIRIKNLMEPSKITKHPTEKIKNSIHELLLRSKYNPVTFVWGPPGTGKTYTLARVAANKYLKNKKVLVLSHSNQAVDVLVREIAIFMNKKNRFCEGDILRYGNTYEKNLYENHALSITQLIEKREPELAKSRKKLIQQRDELKRNFGSSINKRDFDTLLNLESKIVKSLDRIKRLEMKYINDAFIVGTTLAKAAIDTTIFEKEFDVVILDEASMAYIPQVAFASSLGKRIIICGDFKQLPPIASSRHVLVNKWLKNDIFHQTGVAQIVKEGELHPQLFLLKEQRRMHPDISEFTNQYIYQSLVGDHESVKRLREVIAAKSPFSNLASILLDTSFSGDYCFHDKLSNSRINLWHLFLSFQVIYEAYYNHFYSIGYTTPYRAQAHLMDTLLDDLMENERRNANIIAATVHRFQGSERDVMVFDTVDSYPLQSTSMLLSGSESERLINVAITRTKGKFIHVSNSNFIIKNVFKNKTIRQLIEHQELKNQNISIKDIGKWIKKQHPQLQWVYARKIDKVFKDILQARNSIILSLPETIELSKDWIEMLKYREKKLALTVLSNNKHDEIRPNSWIQEKVSFPFIIIDRRVFWLGQPFLETNRVNPPYIAVRLDSSLFTEQLISHLPVDNL